VRRNGWTGQTAVDKNGRVSPLAAAPFDRRGAMSGAVLVVGVGHRQKNSREPRVFPAAEMAELRARAA